MPDTRNILVIDDDELTLTVLRGILQEEGYCVLSTTDGPHGIEVFKQRKPILTLLDLGLSGMGGLEVLRRIRSLDQAAKVIVISGFATEEATEVALGYGALAVLQKPIEVDRLLAHLKSAVE